METVGCDVKSRLAVEAKRQRQKGAVQTRTRCRWTYICCALWTRSDTGLFKTSSPPETGAGRYEPKLYGIFQNYPGFAGFCFLFFFTDGVMNYSRSLVHVGLTIRGSKNILSHIFTPFPPTGTWCPIGAGASSSLSSAITLADNVCLRLLLLDL